MERLPWSRQFDMQIEEEVWFEEDVRFLCLLFSHDCDLCGGSTENF